MSMIERLIFTVVKAGLDYYTADAGQRFERFCLNEMRLSAAEAAKARLYFAGGTDPDGNVVTARPPTWQHGYPRQGGPFPLWALTLGTERETTTYLGADAFPLDEEGSMVLDPETGEPVDPKIIRVEYAYNVLCMAEHPDIAVYYYHLLKRIIRAGREEFIAEDLDPPQLSGADLAPDPRYLPDHIFARQLNVVIEADECWTEAKDGGYADTVRGIHVNDSGDDEATQGSGSTTARVTPYNGASDG